MTSILLIIHVIIAATLIVLILLQQGKGADAGAAFGSGASATVFGSHGSGSFLTRTTAILAAAFFIISLTLAYLNAQKSDDKRSVTEQAVPAQIDTTVPVETTIPAADDVPVIPGENNAPPADARADVPVVPTDKPASDVPQDVPN